MHGFRVVIPSAGNLTHDGPRYHVRCEIVRGEEGRRIRLVVTREETREVALGSPGDISEHVIAAMRATGDTSNPARSVYVCRLVDAEIRRMMEADAEWCAMQREPLAGFDDAVITTTP